MSTIRAYTTIEQSRKLAKMLPLESADMHYVLIDSEKDLYSPGLDKYIGILPHYPAWSLAALLSLIPQEIFDGEYIINITEGCDNKWILTYDHYEHINHSYYGLSTGADNLVDACTDIIIKLKERNII